MRRLPPLIAIEAFVCVARLGSIKAAAEELALSSPALSRRIQALEHFLGRRLFERRHQAMALTPEGSILLARVGPALDSLGEAIDASRGESEIMRLHLAVPTLYASQQLLPRLPELRAAQPRLHIDIDTGGHALSRLGEGLDAAIILARSIEPNFYSRRLAHNRVVPLAARALVERDRIERPEQLAGLTVLLHRDRPDAFETWRRAIGHPTLEPAAVDHFDSGALILEATAQGLGVAFMLDSHLDGAHDDRLVALFGRGVESDYSYWFACRRPALSLRPVKIFHDWLFG